MNANKKRDFNLVLLVADPDLFVVIREIRGKGFRN